MAENAPIPRVDNEAMKELERKATEELLYMIADWTNALVKTGGVYPQVILPPDAALLKLRSMQGGQ